MAMLEVEVWVVVGRDGDYVADTDEDAALDAYCERIGDNVARRTIKLTLQVEAPATTELAAEVPLTGQGAVLKVQS